MTRETRIPAIKAIERIRGGRRLLVMMNFDRHSEPAIPGMTEQFRDSIKLPLFRTLKESRVTRAKGLDVFLYTRGGDTNAVWPIVSLLREFDEDFEILVPFRCHSSGTLVAMGAKQIVMGPLSELSPIDPTTANQFNPDDPASPGRKLGISVEDVSSYKDFLLDSLTGSTSSKDKSTLEPFLRQLIDKVHPLAIGNVHRAHCQIRSLAKELLALHGQSTPVKDRELAVEKLSSGFKSHLHMINRKEAGSILANKIVIAPENLAAAMDTLLGHYRKDFKLWQTFSLRSWLGADPEKEAKIAGGMVETQFWSYLYETRLKVSQFAAIPAGVTVQLPPGQRMPIIPGLPVKVEAALLGQDWRRNTDPQGVTT